MSRARVSQRLWAVAAFAAIGLLSPKPAEAQVFPPLVGGVGGVVAGGWTSLGIFVARSRLGNFVMGTDDLQSLRLEVIPLFAFPIAGALIGSSSPPRLKAVGVGSGAGFVVGGAVGLGIGSIVSETPEAKWAGAVIGSAAGLVVGAVVGGLVAVDGDDPTTPPEGASLTLRIPL